MLLYVALAVILLVLLSWFLRGRMQKRNLPLLSSALELMEHEYEIKVKALLIAKTGEDLDHKADLEEFVEHAYREIQPTWRQFLTLLKKSPYSAAEIEYQPQFFPNLLATCEQLLTNQERLVWTAEEEKVLDKALRDAIKADLQFRLLD